MAKGKNEKIGSVLEPWAGYCGSRIEEFIKGQLTAKVGYVTIPQEKDADGFYHLWGFADAASYHDWLSDPEGEAARRLLNVAIPLMEQQESVRNIVSLTRLSEASIVTNKAEASVEVAYLWQQYNPITKETVTLDEDATVVVSCRTRSASGSWGAWDAAKEFTAAIQSGQTRRIDLGRLLSSDATYQIRLVATGEVSGASTSPVTLTVVYSNVALSYEGRLGAVYSGDSVQLPFRISGSAPKQLRIKIGGYTKNYTLGTTTYTDNTYGAAVTRREFGLTRGAVRAEAWVAFGDDYAAETEHVALQFIYIPEGDTAATPVLAVSEAVGAFRNWTRATLFRYAVYNPAADSTTVVMRLQDADTGEVYLTREQDCANGSEYAFEENFAIESASDDQPESINALLTFTDASGAAFGNNLAFTIDNSDNFAATAGADIVVNPDRRQISIDGTEYAAADLLLHPADSASGWRSNTQQDCTGAQVKVPVLHVAAGNRLTLPATIFDDNTGHYTDGREGSLTMELDIMVSNVVGDAPVADASAATPAGYTGVRFYPTRAVCLSRNNTSEDICDVRFREDAREHVAVNIIRNLRGEGLNLVRIYVNGVSNRSYIYDDDDAFVPVGATAGAPALTLGSDEADLDIYGIRIYRGRQLGSTQIQNDYMAAMPTIEDKQLFKRYNSIFNGTEISYDQCNAMGLNTILRRIPEGGHYPSRENRSKQEGVSVDVRIYTERGNPESLDMRHSGTFSGMTAKGQGTSAMGYYWWNIADGFEDDEEIAAGAYDAADPTHYAKDGRYWRKRSWFNSLDGTSQRYASSYEIEDGRAGITKLVGKANYASPMQSHKLGAIWAYDELWQRRVNNGSDDRPILHDTHACCYEKPFLSFYQTGNGTPVFCGMQTWGSGKGDKHTFGYDKGRSPGYLCISGADNGSAAALYQMPWIVAQNADGAWEGNIYPRSVVINTGDTKNGYCYRAGESDTLSFEVEMGSKYDGGETDKGVRRIADEAKGESEHTLYTTFAEFANFIFSCSPLLEPYKGTADELAADTASLKRDHQYWLFNSADSRYDVYYYNPATARFEPAVMMPTAWGADGRATAWGSPKLTEQLAGMPVRIDTVDGRREVPLEDAMAMLGASDAAVLNDLFSKARTALFAAHAAAYLDVPDVVFHQAFCKLFAATDNRAKNVYPFIDPAVDRLVRWKQDDLDTILATDNQGRQTKPYHALEHTKNAGGGNYWNGENNVLFTLVERAYGDMMRNMMRNMMDDMAQISGSVEQYMHDRFFFVQEYFPAVAYNEAGRVLYEAAQVKVSRGELDVSQAPITQATGDQLECERQFMAQRLPLMMSWCEYEAAGSGSLTFRSVSDTAGRSPVYDVEYTAAQYIYPKLSIGGKKATVYARDDAGEWVAQDGAEPYLCAAGETVRLVCDTDSNTQVTLAWMHYAKALGNLGGLPCADDGAVMLTGRRLRRIECTAPDGTPIEFRPKGLAISGCPNVEEIDLTNASAFTGGFNASGFARLRSLELRGTAFSSVVLPRTSTLTAVSYPASIEAIDVDGQSALASLGIESVEHLRRLSICGEHRIGALTQSLVLLAYAKAPQMGYVAIEGADWSSFGVEPLRWLQGLGARLTGHIAVAGALTFADKLALCGTYGDIDSADNALRLTYARKRITSIAISGESQIAAPGSYAYTLTAAPADGNDFAIAGGRADVCWSLEEAAGVYGRVTDAVGGTLEVVRLDESGTDMRYGLRCTLGRTDGTELTAEYQIGFYRRLPKIGDFAYADGTFDDQFVRGKTVVGIVYKLDEIWQGPDDAEPRTFTGYDKPTAAFKEGRRLIGYRVLVDAKNHLVFHNLDGGAYTTFTWGVYSGNSNDGHGSIGNAIKAATGLSNIYDVEDITNVNWCGLSGTVDNFILLNTYFDSAQEDGFKNYSTGGGYVNQWLGKAQTRAIIKHANTILRSYLLSAANEAVSTVYTDNAGKVLQVTEVPTTFEELGLYMQILERANNKQSKYQQFFYPAAYGCYLYEPDVEVGENLDEQYACTNWYLPATAELMRQYAFHAKSRTGGIGDTDSVGRETSPNRSVIDKMIQAAMDSEDPNEINLNVSPNHVETDSFTGSELAAINRYFHALPEAERPIYSMAAWRALVAGSTSPVKNHSNSGHWATVECGADNASGFYFNNGKSIDYRNAEHRKDKFLCARPTAAYEFII